MEERYGAQTHRCSEQGDCLNMKWALYDFKTSKEEWFESLESVYLKKLKPFAALEVFHLKSIKSDRDEAELKRKHEANIFLSKLDSDDFVILLDEKGKKIDSMGFAKLIQGAQESGKKRVVFLIGGAFGVTDEVRKKSQRMISLSELTMNHLVAESVLLEQIYRAQTILNRIPYHNA